MSKCKAYRLLDEMRCHECHLSWDVTDVDPPTCQIDKIAPVPAPIKNAYLAELRDKIAKADYSGGFDYCTGLPLC